MKRYIILLLFFVVASTGWATDLTKEKPYLEVTSMPHDSLRLQKLNNLVDQAVNDPEKHLFYLDELLEEARLQKNQRYIAKSYLLYIYLYYNKQDAETVNQWMGKLEPLARKEGYYDLLFEGQQCVIETLILRQEFELAEQKSKKMLAEAQKMNHIDGIVAADKCLASTYRSTYRFEQSAEVLEDAYKLLPQVTNSQSKIEVITYLISIYKYMNDLPKWLKYLHIKEAEIIHLIEEDPTQKEYYKGDLMLTYLSYLGYYIELKQKDKAAYYKKLADEYMCDEYAVYQFNYFKGLADYYQFTKEWDKALEFKSKQCGIVKSISYRDYAYILLDKADIFYLMGREKEALETMKEVLSAKDSVRVSIYSKQVEQIKENYDTSQNLLEQARIQRYFQLAILGVVIVLIAILSYFAYRYIYIKRNLIESERNIRQIAEDVRKVARTKERFLSNMSYAIRMPLNEVVNHSLLLASKQQISEEDRLKVGEVILKTSSDLIALVEEILDLSRLEAGRMKFSVTDVDVNALVRDAVGTLKISNVEIVTSVPASQNIWVRIDGTRLMQVFNNLLSEVESDKIVCVELKEEPDDRLSIRVAHTLFASPNPMQDITIRNEINRMIIEYFGGSYEITSDAVHFTLKIVHP